VVVQLLCHFRLQPDLILFGQFYVGGRATANSTPSVVLLTSVWNPTDLLPPAVGEVINLPVNLQIDFVREQIIWGVDTSLVSLSPLVSAGW